MKNAGIVAFLFLIVSHPAQSAAQERYLFLCRSPLLAFDFWRALINIREQGVILTPKIAEEICGAMKAGEEPQCIRVKVDQIKPIASGWGGALALTDGKTRVWFHNPDAGGWVHPDYYIQFVNSK